MSEVKEVGVGWTVRLHNRGCYHPDARGKEATVISVGRGDNLTVTVDSNGISQRAWYGRIDVVSSNGHPATPPPPVPVNMRNHGGGCCGIRHIYDFYDSSQVKSFDEELESIGSLPRLVEVTLTDGQLCEYDWLKDYLKKKGFVLVNRFHNGNSSNYVNVFHLLLSEGNEPEIEDRINKSPWWEED